MSETIEGHRKTDPGYHVGQEAFGAATMVGDSDLLALRSAAMRQKEAFLAYRRYAMTIADRRLAEIFHHETQEEAAHFIAVNRMAARLDPIQADEFRQHELDFLADETVMGDPRVGRAFSHEKVKDPEEWIMALKEAIDLEYHTLNVYQEDACRAIHPEVKELLTRIMNHEKKDLAVFIRELYRLLHRS
ncbi:MAG: hypothetical protein ACM3XZ_11150 [Betaproteobacteria bacterium]